MLRLSSVRLTLRDKLGTLTGAFERNIDCSIWGGSLKHGCFIKDLSFVLPSPVSIRSSLRDAESGPAKCDTGVKLLAFGERDDFFLRIIVQTNTVGCDMSMHFYR